MIKTVLIIIDGFGFNPNREGNAIAVARTPSLDYLWSNFPHTLLKASEEEVGLAFGQIGNSEVGHMAIGCGRVLPSHYQRINTSIEDGSFAQNQAFLKAFSQVKSKGTKLHLIGMISQAGVHADLGHMITLLKLAKANGVAKVYLHPILDGRDTGPREGKIYLKMLEDAIANEAVGIIASIGGRGYAMDRNKNWARTQKYYEAISGTSQEKGSSAQEVIDRSYKAGTDDEMVVPTVINAEGSLAEGDAVIITNFREDRARQLTYTLLPNFMDFKRAVFPKELFLATMTEYEKNLPVEVAFPPMAIKNTLSDVLNQNGISQLHIAETEKYAHVTYFFNGGREDPYPSEEFINIPSDPPEMFAANPQMQASKIAERVVNELDAGKRSFIVVNFANPDMIGHTGDIPKTIAAIEAVDTAVGQIAERVFYQGGLLFITADHGNSEQKIDLKTREVSKDHTINPVPFIMAANNLKIPNAKHQKVTFGSELTGILQDITPTILKALNIAQPDEMTGSSIF